MLDILLSMFLLVLLLMPMLTIALLIFVSSKGGVIYWSNRVGKNSKIFSMPKFRTMDASAPEVATHLIINPEIYITNMGKFLRKTSLDEIPQLISILKGDMSFVGPRPALFNQCDLIEQRKDLGIDKLLPGVTGWAQINGRDNITIAKKIELDLEYMKKMTLLLDVKIIFLTIFSIFSSKGVSH